MNKKNMILAAAVLALATAGSASAAANHNDAFSGMWLVRSPDVTKTVDGKDPPLKPGKRSTESDPARPPSCLPAGPVRTWAVPYPVKLLMRDNQLTMMFEYNHLVRFGRIGAKHPPADEALENYYGDTVAHWEGDTFVMDTTGLNGITWLDHKGLPSSTKTHVVEKLRLTSPNTLEVVATITDPENYTAPWSTRFILDKRPDLRLQQNVCGDPDNRKLPIPPAKG
jgi:hypothetical protein